MGALKFLMVMKEEDRNWLIKIFQEDLNLSTTFVVV